MIHKRRWLDRGHLGWASKRVVLGDRQTKVAVKSPL